MTFWALMICLYLLLRRNNVFATDITSSLRLRRWMAATCASVAVSHRSRGQVIDLFTKKSMTCPSDLSRPDGTGPNVFPLHPATICLAQIQITIDWRSLSDTPRVSKTAHFPPKWSKLYLPTLRAAVDCIFGLFWRTFSFLSPNSDFPYLKLRLSSRESSVLQRGVLSLIP